MLTKKHILTIPKTELTQVYTYFKKHTNKDENESDKVSFWNHGRHQSK